MTSIPVFQSASVPADVTQNISTAEIPDTLCAIYTRLQRLIICMLRLVSFIIVLLFFHTSYSQILYKRQLDSVKTVEIEIKKIDQSKNSNLAKSKILELSIFNNSDSTLCILFSFNLDGNITKTAFRLGPAYDCSADTASYYSLEHPENWDVGYVPKPARPVLISPFTYFNTLFSIDSNSANPKEFHLHYAIVDITYSEIVKACTNDLYGWERALSLICKKTLLPN